MSFFSPFYTTSDSDVSFTPLFRLLSDWDDYSREVAPSNRRGGRRSGHLRTFVPRFDFRETDESFELHGELPGITKDNISVDFTDSQTIVIKGKVERSYEAGTPPAGWVTGSTMRGAITEGGNGHKATVEDVAEEGESSTAPATEKGQVSTKKEEPVGDRAKYWVSERSVGEFSRAFQFPTPINPDGVSASLKDGILNISVPKEKKPAARRINVQ